MAEPSIAANQTKNNKKVLPSMKITNDAKVPVTQETKNTENIRTFSQASAVPTTDSFNNQNIYTHAQETYQGTNNLGEYSGSYPTNSENVANAEQNLVSFILYLTRITACMYWKVYNGQLSLQIKTSDLSPYYVVVPGNPPSKMNVCLYVI